MARSVPTKQLPSTHGYNPESLVLDVQLLLAKQGIITPIDPAHGSLITAVIAAADLLRALGVDPQNAPMRPSR